MYSALFTTSSYTLPQSEAIQTESNLGHQPCLIANFFTRGRHGKEFHGTIASTRHSQRGTPVKADVILLRITPLPTAAGSLQCYLPRAIASPPAAPSWFEPPKQFFCKSWKRSENYKVKNNSAARENWKPNRKHTAGRKIKIKTKGNRIFRR